MCRTAENLIPRKPKKHIRVPWENDGIRMNQQAVNDAQNLVAERNTRPASLLRNPKVNSRRLIRKNSVIMGTEKLT